MALGQDMKRFPMRTGKDAYAKNLIGFFPKEESAIMKYMELIEVRYFDLYITKVNMVQSIISYISFFFYH